MKGRWEIRDRLQLESVGYDYPPRGPARGQRFSSLERARRELAHAVPRSRFYIYDRELKCETS